LGLFYLKKLKKGVKENFANSKILQKFTKNAFNGRIGGLFYQKKVEIGQKMPLKKNTFAKKKSKPIDKEKFKLYNNFV